MSNMLLLGDEEHSVQGGLLCFEPINQLRELAEKVLKAQNCC